MSVLHALMCAASVSAGPPDESHTRADLEARALAMYAPPAAAPAGDGIDTPAEPNAQVRSLAPRSALFASDPVPLAKVVAVLALAPRCGPVPEQMWASCGADSDVAESRCRCGESRFRCGFVANAFAAEGAFCRCRRCANKMQRRRTWLECAGWRARVAQRRARAVGGE